MEKELVIGRLNLFAVVAGIAKLSEVDDTAKRLATEASGTISLSAPEVGSVALRFDGKGGIDFLEKAPTVPAVGMRFISVSALNKMFEGGKAFPIIWTGFWRFSLIKAFIKVSERFGEIMQDTDAYLQQHPNELFKVLSLLFEVATRGVVVLAEHEEHCKNFIAAAPEGSAQFRLGKGKEELACHFVVSNGKIKRFDGKTGEWNAELFIPNLNDAYQLFTGKLDALAAVGLGKVVMRGNLVLLDQINAVFDALGKYLS